MISCIEDVFVNTKCGVEQFVAGVIVFRCFWCRLLLHRHIVFIFVHRLLFGDFICVR